MPKKSFRKSSALSVILCLTAILTEGDVLAEMEATVETKPWQTEAERLRRDADSLRRLERAVVKDGFSSAMCALNIWRSNSKDAGTFDPARYEAFKKEIYQKSVHNVLWWIDVCIEEQWKRDAEFWLNVYRHRASIIDVFDEAKYEEIKAKISKHFTEK